MRQWKKLFIAAVAACTMMCCSIAAYADPLTDTSSVDINKSFALENAGTGTTSQAEDFTLRVVSKECTSDNSVTAPDLGTITAAQFAAGEAGQTKKINIQLPTYTVAGVYQYKLEEVVPDTPTAGVSYYNKNLRLQVTVTNGTDSEGNATLIRTATVYPDWDASAKGDTFTNTYKAGDLQVTKTVTGNLGDKTKYFSFQVKLTGKTGEEYGDTEYTISGGSATGNPTSIKMGDTVSFKLKDGETLKISGIPYGATYEVTETKENGYDDPQLTNGSGTIAAATQTAAVVNNRDGNVPTGIILDNLPYVIILALVAAATVVLIVRKRRISE